MKSMFTLAITLTAIASVYGQVDILTSQGNGADAYVRNGTNATRNYGGSGTVQVRTSIGSGDLRKGYFRFDLLSVAKPYSAASLSLYGFNVGAGTDLWTFNIYGLNNGYSAPGKFGEDWEEGTGNGSDVPGINWNNAPANTADETIDLSSVTLLGSFSRQTNMANGQQIVLSGANLIDFLNADTNNLVTFIVVRATDSAASTTNTFGSGERANTAEHPKLTVTPVPEPGTIAALGIGLASALGLIKRRKA